MTWRVPQAATLPVQGKEEGERMNEYQFDLTELEDPSSVKHTGISYFDTSCEPKKNKTI